MNQKQMEVYSYLAQYLGMRLDTLGGAIYGERGGFGLTIYPLNANQPYALVIRTAATRAAGPLSREETRAFEQMTPSVSALRQEGYRVTVMLKKIRKPEKLLQALGGAIDALVRFLTQAGFQSCCQTCGRTGGTESCYVGGSYLQLCPDCFAAFQQNQMTHQSMQAQKRENLLGGIVGALLGSLIGVACIILLSRMGYVAALSGIVMAICTLKGYEMLAGKLSRRGIVLSVILMLVMTFVGDQLDWAIVVAQEFYVDFFTAFRAVPLLLAEGIIDLGSYLANLLLIYLFLLLGMVPTIMNTLRNQRLQNQLYRLPSAASPAPQEVSRETPER